jgi:hypothetical protein
MRKLLFGLLVIVSGAANAGIWETVKGNGNMKKETRQASGYTGLSLSGSMDVQVAHGSSNTITIEADENLLPYIETQVEDGKLTIRTKKGYNLKSKSKMLVSVSMTKVSSVNVSGSGNITGNGTFANTGETSVNISGSGNINMAFDKMDELDVHVSGSGNVNLKGNSANKIDAHISGSGNIDCSDIKSNEVDAHVSGSGNIRVYANKSIDAKVAGSGNVYYRGDATNISSKASGSGKVLKMK